MIVQYSWWLFKVKQLLIEYLGRDVFYQFASSSQVMISDKYFEVILKMSLYQLFQ